MNIDLTILSKFHNLTKYDIRSYLSDYERFIINNRNDIIQFYSGKIAANITSFNLLSNLIEQSDAIDDIVDIYSNRMNTFDYWELIELLNEVKESLLTINNSSKWLRSVISKNDFDPNIQVDYTLKQFQTLEQVASEVGKEDVDKGWIEIALQNALIEDDYSRDGNNILTLSYANNLSININSVVDNIVGERVYGIDIDRDLSFTDNDITTLSYSQTIKQAVEILATLCSGQTPEFPLDGIQKGLVVGSNRASIPYPILFRQIYDIFSKDDTLKSFKVNSISEDLDSLTIDFEVQTRLGEVIPTQTII